MTNTTQTIVDPAKGMLAFLVRKLRPRLASHIARTARIETAVIGLGTQGERHAGLMKEFGSNVTAAVAPGRQGTLLHQSIPIYASTADMLRAHPHIAAVSIWKHYSTAADAAIEAIEARIPIVVLITEGMPVKDVRSVVVAARQQKTMLLGPNTPGIIFPPERVKIGMLPDVFHPAEPQPGQFSTEGVTICSRSGAILYHMSDALASAGIAQNAVIGIGGDSVIGSTFSAIVPTVMEYPNTDLVVVAGEIGGCQEERLAEDIRKAPDRYPKPIVALISGRCAPVGKTMGHAGALIAPGAEYGTFETKKAALESSGVTVVNSQPALVDAVSKSLGHRTYFTPEDYYARMQAMWDAPPPTPTWITSITEVEPNNLVVRGHSLATLITRRGFIDVAALLVTGKLPNKQTRTRLDKIACNAAAQPVPRIGFANGDDVSKRLAALILADKELTGYEGSEVDRTMNCLGRVAAFLARILKNKMNKKAETFADLACSALAGQASRNPGFARMLEAAMVASVDHGVTPPSAQATILASSVRAPFEVAIASGVSAITHVHGGAGAEAAQFLADCVSRSEQGDVPLPIATKQAIKERVANGERIEGMGHRIHTHDPRCEVLWKRAKQTGITGPCVATSQIIEDAFESVRGMRLPINVDGVIGAIVADMGLDPPVAKALFIFGRIAGLAAHHFEEISTQLPMRNIDFAKIIYKKE